MIKTLKHRQGRRQKIFHGGPTEKRPKISKIYRKIALFSLFQGERGGNEKKAKNSKKGRKWHF